MTQKDLKLKLVHVGDGAVGKTCLLMVYAKREYPTEYVPSIVFDNYTCTVPVNQQRVQLSLWDTAGQEDYDDIRPFSYENTDVFLICFSINQRETFNNVRDKWVPDVRAGQSPKAKIIIVGTKGDLRNDPSVPVISLSEIESMRKQIKAESYVECSALRNVGVKEVYDTAIRVSLLSQNACCSIL
ncbi:MAG: putative Cell division control protein 42 [Streblomastix strix]|uniref:Putative Cell division control protein 42 n=1 Tax=Streblomastix strix TaxID=222440 RepID=A0A5J4X988_9EUKA|nr:MAG: putative Cell division control protein 42 [Streblomastix strix]